MKKYMSFALCLILILSLFSFNITVCAAKLDSDKQIEAGFSNIRDLILKYNPTVEQNKNNVSKARDAVYQAEGAAGLNPMASGMAEDAYANAYITEVSMKGANDQIAFSAENLYISHFSMNKQIEIMEYNLLLLKNNKDMIDAMVRLGLSSADKKREIELSIKELEASVSQLKNQVGDIKSQFNMMLGRSAYGKLDFKEIEFITQKVLDKIDEKADYAKAMDNSVEIKAQNMMVSNTVGTVKDKQKDALVTLKSGLDVKFKNISLALFNKAEDVDVQRDKLEKSDADLKNAALKYRLGLMSKVNYESAKLQNSIEKENLVIKELELVSAYRKYFYMVEYGVFMS